MTNKRVSLFITCVVDEFFPEVGESMVKVLRRLGVNDARRARVARIAGVSYAGLFVLLLWQALRGQPLLSPDPLMLVGFASWATATVVALTWPFRARRDASEASLNWINP